MSVCDRLLQQTFKGIEFRYKLDDTINDMATTNPNQKFTAAQMEKALVKKGVSPKEIKQSDVLTPGMNREDIAYTAKEWRSILDSTGDIFSGTKPHHIKTVEYSGNEAPFADITLGKKGEEYNEILDNNPSYKVREKFIGEKKDLSTNLRHEMDKAKRIQAEAIRNSAEKELEPKLKELRKRQALAISKDKDELAMDITEQIKKLKLSLPPRYKDPYKEASQLGWNRSHVDNINGKDVTVLNEFQSDWLQAERQDAGLFETNKKTSLANLEHDVPDDYMREAHKDILGRLTTIADFPMSPKSFHQYMIVDSIDQAIKNGTNKVVIPIERGNELMGSPGVTKFYAGLGSTLGDIKKKLAKEGLDIKIGREAYGNSKPRLPRDLNTIEQIMESVGDFYDEIGDAGDQALADALRSYSDETIDLDRLKQVFRSYRLESLLNQWIQKGGQSLHTIEVVSQKDTAAKWSIYSLLGAVGLGDLATKLEEGGNDGL